MDCHLNTHNVQGGIFHSGPDDGLCFYWHDGSHTASEPTMKHWFFFFFFFLLPSSPLSLPPTISIPLSPSPTHTLIHHRQAGLICCIGQCQSSTLSCGNRGLMISILRLGRLCYIYFSCCALRVCGRSLPPAFYGFLTTSSDCYGDNSETGVILPHPEAFFN